MAALLIIISLLLIGWPNLFPFNNILCPQKEKGQVWALENIQRQSDTCGELEMVQNDIRTISPWSVAIFRKSKNGASPKFLATGTIVSSTVILSVVGGPAGLTLEYPPPSFSGSGEKYPVIGTRLFIAAGVNSTDFLKHDEHAQYATVSFVEPIRNVDPVNIYFHHVLYHLRTPLTLGSPYVREICLPLHITSKKFTWPYEAVFGHDVLLGGFVQTKVNREQQLSSKDSWTLAVWKGKSGPRLVCESHFRYHYKPKNQRTPAMCHTTNHDKTTSDTLYTNVVDSIWSNRTENPHHSHFCSSHGTSVTSAVRRWSVQGINVLIPSNRYGECEPRRLAYFMDIALIPVYKRYNEWMYYASKCPPAHFACGDPSAGPSCIPWSKLCDGLVDCAENADDEHYTICGPKSANDTFLEQKSSKLSNTKNEAKYCSNLPYHLTNDAVTCAVEFGGDPQNIDCTSVTSLLIGARVKVKCNGRHSSPAFSYQSLNLFCDNAGEWRGLRPFHCEKVCGLPNDQVNGGTEANLARMPWQALIYKDNKPICGATLIEKTFLITHASCMLGTTISHKNEGRERKNSNFRVALLADGGSHGDVIEKDKIGQMMIEVKNVWISPGNDSSASSNGQIKDSNDHIALIEILPLNDHKGSDLLTPVCYHLKLISGGPPAIGEMGKVSSDCHDNDRQRSSSCQVGVQVVSIEECIPMISGGGFSSATYETDGKICTKILLNPPAAGNDLKDPKLLVGSGLFFPHGRRSSVHGKGKERFILKGILMDSGPNNFPLFVNMDHHASWILDILETNS